MKPLRRIADPLGYFGEAPRTETKPRRFSAKSLAAVSWLHLTQLDASRRIAQIVLTQTNMAYPATLTLDSHSGFAGLSVLLDVSDLDGAASGDA